MITHSTAAASGSIPLLPAERLKMPRAWPVADLREKALPATDEKGLQNCGWRSWMDLTAWDFGK